MKKNFLTATLLLLFTLSSLCVCKAQSYEVSEPELAIETGPGWCESPIWDIRTDRLYWIDMRNRNFHVTDPESGSDKAYKLPEQPGTVILTSKGDKVIIPLVSAIFAYDFTKDELIRVVDNPDMHNGKPNRFNDGDCDPAGRLWVGTENNDGSARLYMTAGDMKLQEKADGIRVSNGLCFSKNKKTLYYIDSATGGIDAFDYDNKTGDISNRRTIIKYTREMGTPDGMTIDNKGTLWVCSMDRSQLLMGWNPKTGEKVAEVKMPTKNVLACAFGGKKMDILYITTENGIYSVTTGSRGIKPYLFKEKF